MAEARTPSLAGVGQPGVEPWLQRLAERPPWTPARLALAIATVLLGIFFAVEAALGRLPLVLGDGADAVTRIDFRIALVLILLVAYLPAAQAYGAQGARRALVELRPALRPREHANRLAAGAGRFDAAALRRAGWLGAAATAAIPFFVDRRLDAWAFWTYASESIIVRVLLPIAGWLAGRFVYSVWAESRRLSELGRTHVAVDLLDPRAFAPLTRQGLRNVLLMVGLASIVALFLYDWQKRGLLEVVVAGGGVALTAAAAALLLPLRGARQAIVAAKRTELDWCDAELRRARAALEAQTTSGGRSLADLVAWRALVAEVHEWPLDAPALGRFVLYLAIPLGSWLGGALVERVVDAALR